MPLWEHELKNAYVGEYHEIEEYVMLSNWWDINRYSESSTIWMDIIRNQTTHWDSYISTTDRDGRRYFTFNKKIVWFEVVMDTTYAWGAYEIIEFNLMPSASFNNNQHYYNPINAITIAQTAHHWWSGNTWIVYIDERVNDSSTIGASQNKSDRTAIWTWTGTLQNWVWHIEVSLSSGEIWSYDLTPNSVNEDLYVAWFFGDRRYTWKTGNIYSAKVYLQ